MPTQINEQPILIWSPTQNKWISTYLYFTDQPATTTNILDIDNGYTDPGVTGASGPPGPQGVPGPRGASGDGYISFGPDFSPNSGYQVFSPVGSIFPTSEIWYTDSNRTLKIVEKDFTWSGPVPTTILYKLYAADGITITQELRDIITYTNHIIVNTVSRTII